MSAPPTRDDTTPEIRAARRGGILGVVLLPVLAALGVMLLALSSLTPVFVPAGVCLILLSAVGVWTGVVALRGSGPVAALRVAAAAVAVAGILAALTVALTVPVADNGTGLISTFALVLVIASPWWTVDAIARAIRKAEHGTAR